MGLSSSSARPSHGRGHELGNTSEAYWNYDDYVKRLGRGAKYHCLNTSTLIVQSTYSTNSFPVASPNRCLQHIADVAKVSKSYALTNQADMAQAPSLKCFLSVFMGTLYHTSRTAWVRR
jgi:hypothetical protein